MPVSADAHLRRFLNDHPVATVLLAPDGTVQVWNRAAEQLLGHEARAIEGHPYPALVLDDDAWAETFGTAVGGGTVEQRFLRRRHADGSPRLVRSTVAPLRGANRAIVGVVTTLEPEWTSPTPSDPRQAQLLDAFLANAPLAAWILDPAGHVVWINEAGAHDLGHAPGDVIGRSIRTLLPEPEAERLLQHDALVRATGIPSARTERLSVGNGRTVVYRVRRFCIPPEGDPRGRGESLVGGIGSDITSQVAAEEARARTEAQFRTIVETAAEGIWIVDAEWRTTFVNEALARMLGRTRDEFLGRAPLDFVAAEQREAVAASMARREAGRADAVEFPLLHADGRIVHTLSTANPLPSAHGFVGAVAMLTDITERREAEAREKAREAALRETQKLESLGLLAGGIAHDFNNLLTAILGAASLAREAPDDAEQVAEALRLVESSVRRAATLTRQMLAYSGRATTERRRLALGPFVRESLDLLRVSMDRRHVLELDVPDTLPAVEADEAQLQQVIMNLVINASEAIGPQPGRVSVTATVRAVDAEQVAPYVFGERLTGTLVALEVRDTGSGMSSDVITRIFEPFFTTKAAGRGLGMSAVLGIVRSHGGALGVDTAPGHGTCFTVLLPPADPVAPEAALAPAARTVVPRRRVLLVEDEPPVREIVALLLEELGHAVVATADGEAATAALRAAPEAFDVVLCDLSMPGQDGGATIAALRRVRPGIPVVLMSGYGEAEGLARVEAAGGATFLAKPFDATRLSAALAAACPPEMSPP